MRQLLHHGRLLWLCSLAKKGTTLILKSGKYQVLRHQPRVGQRTWGAYDGRQYDSDQITAIIDTSACGDG